MAVGILGPGPGPDRGGTLGGMACHPPRPLSRLVGETWGGRPMLIMSTASLSTPGMSSEPPWPGTWPPRALYWPGGTWPAKLGGGVVYWGWYWGDTGPPLPPPPPPPPPPRPPPSTL